MCDTNLTLYRNYEWCYYITTIKEGGVGDGGGGGLKKSRWWREVNYSWTC